MAQVSSAKLKAIWTHLEKLLNFRGGNKWRRDEASKMFDQCIDHFLEMQKLF